MLLTPIRLGAKVRLRDRDALPPRGIPTTEHDLDHEQEKLLSRLEELQNALYAEHQRALLVVLQARDAGGKDGTIRRVFGSLNPQGCAVAPFRRPTDAELAHDYLWRAHLAVPAKGMIGIFNRSHYEDVIVVRVRKLVPAKLWRQRYRQINDFERMLTENGVTILKFFLHISKDEQRERLIERLKDPTKNWKFNAEDLDDRALWAEYTRGYEDALSKCSTPWAPWYVVPGDRKHVRNFLVTQALVQTLERMKPRYPRAEKKVLALAKKIV
jgi:PPK2 family polyphosphate:nucleotide phosphotransferase